MVKSVALTLRDKTLLGDLREYGLHSTRHLAARHFPGVQLSTVLRRLRILEAAGYLQRIPDLKGSGNAWGLAKAGSKYLAPSATKIHFPRFIQEHDLKLTALRLRLEEVGLAKAWKPEHDIRAKVAGQCARAHVTRNIPDALMAVEANGFREAVAVELELSQKNQMRYRQIFKDYLAKKNLWGFWYVVGTTTIANQLTTAFEDVRYKKDPPYFCWSHFDAVIADPLNAPVHRLGISYRLKDFWQPKVPEAAHSPAQPMGTLCHEHAVTDYDLSNENEIQIPLTSQG